jgi:hypothetical protein
MSSSRESSGGFCGAAEGWGADEAKRRFAQLCRANHCIEHASRRSSVDNARGLQMLRITGAFLLCAAAMIAQAQSQSETFVIQAGGSGREATIKIPVGAVATFSANAAEALVGYADPKVEAMRLSGDVRISVMGTSQPIQIKADNVVLELTADETPGTATEALALQSSDPSVTIVQTLAGAMQIKADRVEHEVGPETGA